MGMAARKSRGHGTGSDGRREFSPVTTAVLDSGLGELFRGLLLSPSQCTSESGVPVLSLTGLLPSSLPGLELLSQLLPSPSVSPSSLDFISLEMMESTLKGSFILGPE